MFKKILLAAMFTAALSAGAVSVRQLRTSATPTACGSPCTRSTICARLCFCYFGLSGGTTGVCQPEGPPPAPGQ
jgi:hypothetical protein